MAGIQIGGIASGMDTESIITQLMSIESAPRTRTARQQVTVQARQDALRQIDTKLTNLKLAAGDLRSASHLDAHAGDLQRQRERAHGPPGHRRRPGRLHRQRRLAGQRGLAHLRSGTPAAATSPSTTRRDGSAAEQDLRPDGHEPRRRRLHHQQRRRRRPCGRSTSAASCRCRAARPATTPTGASTPPGRPSARTTASRDGANASLHGRRRRHRLHARTPTSPATACRASR